MIKFDGVMHGLSTEEIEAKSRPLLAELELGDASNDYAVNYSRGMKKKLAFICALLHEPELLILDEPTSGLDPIATRAFNEIVSRQVESGV